MQDAVPTILAVLAVAALLYLPIHVVRRALAARRARRMAKASVPATDMASPAPGADAALAVAQARIDRLEREIAGLRMVNDEMARNAEMRSELCARYVRIIETLGPGMLPSAERRDVETREAA
jgi:hypothetical protein